MSEENKKRSLQDIGQEYQQLAFKAGNLQYAISEQTKDLGLLNSQMRDLNFEFNKVKAQEEAAAKVPTLTEVKSE